MSRWPVREPIELSDVIMNKFDAITDEINNMAAPMSMESIGEAAGEPDTAKWFATAKHFIRGQVDGFFPDMSAEHKDQIFHMFYLGICVGVRLTSIDPPTT